jgi:hypothetical protein
MTNEGTMFLLLMGAHCLCDYPLQGDFLARGKNQNAPIPGVPWWQCLWAHAAIHGLAVGVITGNPFLGMLEYITHGWIDFGKCQGWYGFNVDQAIHWGCKVLWVILAVAWRRP